ncbi:hypothetical protein RJ639_000040, partial [Escallonia herrerae]
MCHFCNSDLRGGGGGSLIWSGDLADVREFLQKDSKQDLFGLLWIEIVNGVRNTRYQNPDHYHSHLGH